MSLVGLEVSWTFLSRQLCTLIARLLLPGLGEGGEHVFSASFGLT